MGCHQCTHIKETEIKEIIDPIQKQESVAFDDLKLPNARILNSNEEKKQIEIIYHQEIKKTSSPKNTTFVADDGKNINSCQNQKLSENETNKTLNLPNFPFFQEFPNGVRKNEKKLNANLIMAEDVRIMSNFCKKESEDLIEEELALDENVDLNFLQKKAPEDPDEFENF